MKTIDRQFVSILNIFIIILVFLGIYYIINYTNLFRLENSKKNILYLPENNFNNFNNFIN